MFRRRSPPVCACFTAASHMMRYASFVNGCFPSCGMSRANWRSRSAEQHRRADPYRERHLSSLLHRCKASFVADAESCKPCEIREGLRSHEHERKSVTQTTVHFILAIGEIAPTRREVCLQGCLAASDMAGARRFAT
jgi:hypothetical protein